MTIHLGKTAKRVREAQGLTQRAAADKLGISCVHLCNFENNKSAPSPALIAKYRELWNVDLYILAWCLFGDRKKLPKAVQGPMEKLVEAWFTDLKSRGLLGENDRGTIQCSTYKN